MIGVGKKVIMNEDEEDDLMLFAINMYFHDGVMAEDAWYY